MVERFTLIRSGETFWVDGSIENVIFDGVGVMDPIDQIDPVEPIDPAEPIDPVEPVDPVEPLDPVATGNFVHSIGGLNF